MQLEARREMWKNTTNGAFYMQHKSGHQLVQMVLAGQDSGQAARQTYRLDSGWKYIFFHVILLYGKLLFSSRTPGCKFR